MICFVKCASGHPSHYRLIGSTLLNDPRQRYKSFSGLLYQWFIVNLLVLVALFLDVMCGRWMYICPLIDRFMWHLLQAPYECFPCQSPWPPAFLYNQCNRKLFQLLYGNPSLMDTCISSLPRGYCNMRCLINGNITTICLTGTIRHTIH